MATVTQERPDTPESLSADTVGSWMDGGFEPLFAMSHRDYYPVQIEVMRRRFEQFRDSVSSLEKLAKRQGVDRIDSVADALPLFFDHRVYKSYPAVLIETRDFPKLTAWLNRLTTHDLTKLDLSGLKTLDDWLYRLDDFGMFVGHSTGTTGKLSFIPRSRSEIPNWTAVYQEAARATSGVDPRTDFVPTFFPGYRGGHHMMLKMLSLFNIPAAGGPEHYHTLYQTHVSSDLMSLAGRMQSAEDRGELDKLGLDPNRLEAREAMIAQAKRRPQDLEAFFTKLIEEYRGRRIKLGGTAADLIRAAWAGQAKGLTPSFAPGSFIMSGGGLKGMKDAPEDWEGFVRGYFGIEKIGMVYGMSEIMTTSPRCSHGNYHFFPQVLPILLDRDANELPREGVQTGRVALFDLLAETYWGGFISGDQLTIHWDEDCGCGWKGAYAEPNVARFAEMEGGDDKITCAGSQKAYDEFMDYVAQV